MPKTTAISSSALSLVCVFNLPAFDAECLARDRRAKEIYTGILLFIVLHWCVFFFFLFFLVKGR